MEKNQCKNCPFNDYFFNLETQGDTIKENQKDEQIKKYCYMFDKGIPDEILKNERECKFKNMGIKDTKK